MASQAATCELDVGAGRDGHVDVAKDRPCLNVNLVGRAVCVSEIDDHVAEERDGDQLVLDIPAPDARHASALDLLQIVAEHGRVRPSEIAGLQQVHPSLVTRQVQELEALGYVEVGEDSGDRRAWLVTLTPAGAAETCRLQQVGLDRFATFVADWEPREVQTLTALLEKLERSKAAVAERERRPARRGMRERAA
jgi:DNA-binding MarR family transcriptional regulator